MTVRVLLFGAEARFAGAPAVDVHVPGSPVIRDIRVALAAQHPALAASMAHARLARNHAFARPDEPVAPGVELALIGLVSGG
jgi:molybdopterin synthase catalytic subunit